MLSRFAFALVLAGCSIQPMPDASARPSAFADIPPELLTVAEASDFRATSRHEEVVALMDRLAERSPYARRIEMGTTVEGRSIPMLILADPPVSTAEEAAARRRDGKLVVLAIGNIHAGEVDGKEALLMLARELVIGDRPTADPNAESRMPNAEFRHPLLDDLVICLAPIYNADGNERMDPGNRRNQDGPVEGMGVRHNAQGLDLNRDFLKLDAPETQALVRFLRRWDPAVFIDTHTTNGSPHRYLITYAGPKVPAGDSAIIEYVRDTMLPAITNTLRATTGMETFWYGNFGGTGVPPVHGRDGRATDRTAWTTFPAEGRYSTSYVGLRNRIGILSESYSYAPYKDRIYGTLDFVRAILDYSAVNRRTIQEMLSQADTRARRAVSADREEPIALRTEAVAREGKFTILGYVEEERDGQRIATQEHAEYEVDLLDDFRATLTVERPHAYLIPSDFPEIVENLQRHGLEVEQLREDIELDVEVYLIDSIERSERPFQQRHLTTIEATPHSESRMIEAGTLLVRTNQNLGRLAVYLLEPQSEDGLAMWSFLEHGLPARANEDNARSSHGLEAHAPGIEFPILRLPLDTQPILTAPLPALDEDRTFGQRITWGSFSRNRLPSFSGSPMRIIDWLDEHHWLQVKDGRLHRVEALTGRSEPFLSEGQVRGMTRALAELPTIGLRTARQWANRSSFHMDPQRAAVLFNHENDLYYVTFDGSRAVRLTSNPRREEMPMFSPDGRFVAFVREFDLYVVDVETGAERALTTGGHDLLRNGKHDWVYFEELYRRSWRAFWWSPDSQRLAFLQTDSSMVPQFTIVNDANFDQVVERSTYPKPGQPNPQVRLGIVTVAGGEPTWADLSDYTPTDMLISGVHWQPDSESLFVYVQNRIQSWLDVCRVPVSGSQAGTVTQLHRDETEAWVRSSGEPTFLSAGAFIISSERSGYRHLYHFDRDGREIGAITTGDWEIRGGVEHVDEALGWVYFMGMRDNALGANLYRTTLDGNDLQRLTSPLAPGSAGGWSSTRHDRRLGNHPPAEPGANGGAGSHSVNISPDGRYFITSWSSRTSPTRVSLFDNESQHVRTLDTNPVPALEEFDFGREEHIQISARDGFPLEATILYPPDFDPARRYPVWFTTYAGPQAPSIRDSWTGGRTRDQALANEGIIIYQADPRSASGKGAVTAWTAYRRLGVPELADIEDAIRHLHTRPYVDASRIGMSGFSYGGFITAYAMTNTDLFCAGIAGGSVTDWRDYDTIYTERYMSTPQDNPDGYRKTSVLRSARNLHGRLRLVHGSLDDNVHAQNTIRLVRALQDADKDFELMLYPTNRHGIRGRHYQRTTYEFIVESLGVRGEHRGDAEADDEAQTVIDVVGP